MSLYKEFECVKEKEINEWMKDKIIQHMSISEHAFSALSNYDSDYDENGYNKIVAFVYEVKHEA